jgi:hypothetical protein
MRGLHFRIVRGGGARENTDAPHTICRCAQQIERLINNDARQRDDMAVLTAVVMRLDGTVTSLLPGIVERGWLVTRLSDASGYPEPPCRSGCRAWEV